MILGCRNIKKRGATKQNAKMISRTCVKIASASLKNRFPAVCYSAPCFIRFLSKTTFPGNPFKNIIQNELCVPGAIICSESGVFDEILEQIRASTS